VVGISAMNFPTDTFDFDQEPMTQLQLSFSQAIPFPGKRQLRRDAAEHEATAAQARIEERYLTLAADVRSTWWAIFYLDRTLEIIQQNQSLMRDFVEITQTKYRVGDGLQQDVLLAQLELSRLLERQLRTQSMRSAMQAALNHLLNMPGDTIATLPVDPPNELLPAIPSRAELLERAVTSRPQLSAESALIDAARSRLDLANKDLRPDFRVGMAYGLRDGRNPLSGVDRPDFLSLNFGVTVPLYSSSKQHKAFEQRTHEVSQRRYSRNDTLRSVEAAVTRHMFDYESAASQVELVQGAIIPQARQTVASMLSGYQTSQVDFLNVINSQITLYNAQINYWESFSNAKSALARLAAAAGEEVLYE
jgi:outer membrane protein TolC